MGKRTNKNPATFPNRKVTIVIDGTDIHHDNLVVIRNPTVTGRYKFKWVDGDSVTVWGPCYEGGASKAHARHQSFKLDRIQLP